jgi:hypothetical protein
MLTKPSRLHFCGFNVQGDLGGTTTYRSQRKRVVTFPRVSPLNPPSLAQEIQRGQFTTAAASWRALTELQRTNWRNAAQRAHLTLGGYNLWTWWTIRQDRAAIATIERQTGITLLP